MPRHGRRIAALLSLWVAESFLGGCVPGVTHHFEVVSYSRLCGFCLSPDSTQIGIGVQVDEGHPATDLGTFFYGGSFIPTRRTLEVLVYDLSRRRGPERVAVLRRLSDQDCRLIGWVDSSIVFSFDYSLSGRSRYLAVSPANGRCDTISDPADPRLRKSGGPGLSAWQMRHVVHLEERGEEFFLWHPETRQGEFLFALPLTHDRHREILASARKAGRAGQRRADAIHRIWDVQTVERPDSVHFLVETYVPRPGERACEYQVLGNLEFSAHAMVLYPSSRTGVIGLFDRRVWLGPTPTQFDITYPRAGLLALCRKRLGKGMTLRRASEEMSLDIRLKPVHRTGDDTTFAPGVWDGDQMAAFYDAPYHRPAVWLTR